MVVKPTFLSSVKPRAFAHKRTFDSLPVKKFGHSTNVPILNFFKTNHNV